MCQGMPLNCDQYCHWGYLSTHCDLAFFISATKQNISNISENVDGKQTFSVIFDGVPKYVNGKYMIRFIYVK